MKKLSFFKNFHRRNVIVIVTLGILLIASVCLAWNYLFLNADTPAKGTIDNVATATYKDASGITHTEQSDVAQVIKENSSIPSKPADTADVKPIPKIALTKIHPDAEAYLADHLNLNDEYIIIKNVGDTVETSYWKIKNGRNEVVTLPTYKFAKDATITIFSGKKPKQTCNPHWEQQSSSRVLWKYVRDCTPVPANYFYLARTSEMWRNDTDSITVYQGSRVILSQTYSHDSN